MDNSCTPEEVEEAITIVSDLLENENINDKASSAAITMIAASKFESREEWQEFSDAIWDIVYDEEDDDTVWN